MDERILSHIETLLYYDGPQLIVAHDQIGQIYICLISEVNEKEDHFICVPISKRKLELLSSGECSLRNIFEEPEVPVIYEAIANQGDLNKISTHEIDKKELSSDWLPDADSYLEKQEAITDTIVRESIERGRAIITCTLNPPEAKFESKISVENLIEGIGLYQRVLKYAYQKSLQSIANIPNTLRNSLLSSENYKLEVFGFSEGSFTIHMQTAMAADLVGYSNISRALEIVDTISNNIDNTKEAFDIVAKYGGHFATAYKDLLKFIVDKEIPFNYEWSMPQYKNSFSGKIIPREAKPLYEALIKQVEIGIVKKFLHGKFTLLGKSGTWKLISEEDDKEYSGTSELDLAGTVFLSKRYSLICEERLLLDNRTGKEIKKLHLIAFEPI